MGENVMTTEERLVRLGLKLPSPPEPFGMYVEAVQTGSLLFLTGMFPTEGREVTFSTSMAALISAAGNL